MRAPLDFQLDLISRLRGGNGSQHEQPKQGKGYESGRGDSVRSDFLIA
jgi:hypothetical protein